MGSDLLDCIRLVMLIWFDALNLFLRVVGSELLISAIAYSAEGRVGKFIYVLTICGFGFADRGDCPLCRDDGREVHPCSEDL